jgi:hypothetical protein
MARTCSCCGGEAAVLLKPSKNCKRPEPTVVCHRCDFIKAWPTTEAALRRRTR